ncbi:N-acetylmuramoyl-L-alanine amidase [Thomasclavelia cocleata]|uniref:N-acetylmuramoyl-L-alanine amidase family protein n=1 Tax=Thomasclavelia cocleata TaxID=69824 RepID=UPI000B822075|nr:N-acetylmuramoyl-L-alanine amidase [Thomasclavelia cocleata]MCR1961628.1 N-acetylmuramoyl-L-alanine amidase [Thomasclavelia cocleata]NDO42758.1 N-acetylmuramoyl-L-alanine amidase [Thomasclavelia cocleata]PJN80377.1 N-acetylmuramoyl-L-alanine amidase [Thomasclavelia cocleata]
MKKLLIVFLILFFITGCKQEKQFETVIIKTKVIKQQQNGIVEKQGEKVKPIIQEPVDELQVVGNNRLIVIDAGHQRYGNNAPEPIGPGAIETKAKVTSGATGVVTGNLESQINLEVALKLKGRLEKCGYQVIMVRTSQDVDMSNSERAKIANENKADAFIRLHCNSDDVFSTRGILTIAPSNTNRFCSQISDASQLLSKCVLDNICQATGAKDRGVMISDNMSGINWCQVPVTIVEMGFISNPEEDRLLSDGGYQDKIVTGIIKGINEFIN